MPENIQITQESISIDYDGEALSNHEMSLEEFANSLLAFKSLAERTNTIINGKDKPIYIKIKGSVNEGSVSIDLLAQWIGPVVPFVKPIVFQTIKEFFNYLKFLSGQPFAKKEAKKDESGAVTMHVTNQSGQVTIVNQNIINMSGSQSIKSDTGRFFAPLESTVEKIKCGTKESIENDKPDVLAFSSDKDIYIPTPDEQTDESTSQCTLELVTINFDGKPTGWRFYDEENDAEFSSSISDANFLESVKNKKLDFLAGDRITAEMTTTKAMVSQRKKTSRNIIKVYSRLRGDEVVAFE